jgi:DNA modification methylase
MTTLEMPPTIEYDHSQIDWGQELVFPNTRTFAQLSHRIFNRYPARSISLVPRAIIASTSRPKRRALRVLDPFMGSGTTAVEAVLGGATPYGVEIDPLARLISDVRIAGYGLIGIQEIRRIYERVSRYWHRTKPDWELAPRLHNVRYWFDDQQFEELLRLKTSIYRWTQDDRLARDFFRIVLADMIRPCSRAERQTLKPYISKKYKKTPSSVGEAFDKSFEAHARAIHDFELSTEADRATQISWLGHDATNFELRDHIDVAITSPPYTNALDYVRCIKIESAWADCGDDDTFIRLKRGQVGDDGRKGPDIPAEVASLVAPAYEEIARKDPARAATVAQYFADMWKNLSSVFDALRPGGCYHLIVGDSEIRGTEVPTHEYIAELGKLIGFEWSNYYWYRIRDHRLSIPRQNQGGKIKAEHVISLTRPEDT